MSSNSEARKRREEAEGTPETVTITISRTLADVLAHEWIPLDDEDPMIELFDACREAVER